MARPANLLQAISAITKSSFFEKRLKVQQTNDGVAAFIRGKDGNAYEVIVRPANEAKIFKEGIRPKRWKDEDPKHKAGFREQEDEMGSAEQQKKNCKVNEDRLAKRVKNLLWRDK